MSLKHENLSYYSVSDLNELEFELRNSKERLERILDSEVDYICFPEGKFNISTVLLSKSVGYIRCYSSLPGFYYNEFKRWG